MRLGSHSRVIAIDQVVASVVRRFVRERERDERRHFFGLAKTRARAWHSSTAPVQVIVDPGKEKLPGAMWPIGGIVIVTLHDKLGDEPGRPFADLPHPAVPATLRNAPRRNRTYNLVIKSHLLCQLS